ncbi:MAG: T9SS type A sorting domain-containing protein [Bacteroidetes bacterium]|nr:T9SS type A sorting domain-containing protein [Bacteroidota bacterium]
MNAGPFTMAPGDSQEVIFAIIIGQGASALESVTRLKEVDQYAQTIADNHYELPDDTTFYNFSMVGNIQILSDNLNNDGQVNNGELIRLGFDVTNIYIDSASFMIIPRILSAGVIGQDIQGIVIENLPQPPSPGYIYSLSEDEAPLIYVSPDFDQTEIAMRIDILDFASGMWNYHDVTVPVTILDYEPSDSVQWVDQIIGDSEGKVGYWVVNPNELNGHTYTVSFTLSYSEMTEELGISLFDETTGEWLLTKHALPDEYLFDFPAIDGFKLVLEDAPKGFKGIYQVANGNGPIQGGLEESITEDMLWINFLTSQETPTEQSDGGWFFTTHGGGTPNNIDSFNDRVLRGDNWNRVRGNIFEMRFTNDAAINGMGYRRFEDGLLVGNVPFEQWNIGPYADDTSDDYRMLPVILNGTIIGNANDDIDAFDFWGDDANSSANNDPSSDWVYWGNPDNTSPGTVGYDQWVSTGVGNSPLGGWMEVMARTRLMNWNGSASHIDSIELGSLSSPYPINWTSVDTAIFINNGWYLDPENDLGVVTVSGDYAYGRILHYPDIGTIYRWVSYRPVDTTDVFQFTTEDNVVNVNDETLPLIFSLSQNFPNPFNPSTTISFSLPVESKVSIKIYNVLGQLVKVLFDNNQSAGNHNITFKPTKLASGIYLYRIIAHSTNSKEVFVDTKKLILLK